MKKQCRFCKQTITYSDWRQYACHCASCDKNDKVKYKYIKGVNTKKLRNPKKLRILYCKKCNSKYILNLTDAQFLKNRYKKHCSQRCANSRIQLINTKRKISIALNRKVQVNCKFCSSPIFVSTKRSKTKKFCSRKCFAKYRSATRLLAANDQKKYYINSTFKFNLKDFPLEFSFALINAFGWYHFRKNKNGISRDHRVPISYGFKHSINPQMLAHPANCQLLRHNDNKIKGSKLLTSVDELQKRITAWNEKYPNCKETFSSSPFLDKTFS